MCERLNIPGKARAAELQDDVLVLVQLAMSAAERSRNINGSELTIHIGWLKAAEDRCVSAHQTPSRIQHNILERQNVLATKFFSLPLG